MAEGEPDKTVKLWMNRIRAADKAREEWESRYEVVRCREYWAGIQREDPTDGAGNRKAQVNLIAADAAGAHSQPVLLLSLRPSRRQPGQDGHDGRDGGRQGAAPPGHGEQPAPRPEVRAEGADAHRPQGGALGVRGVEVGYSADFIDNPSLKDHGASAEGGREHRGRRVVREGHQRGVVLDAAHSSASDHRVFAREHGCRTSAIGLGTGSTSTSRT